MAPPLSGGRERTDWMNSKPSSSGMAMSLTMTSGRASGRRRRASCGGLAGGARGPGGRAGVGEEEAGLLRGAGGGDLSSGAAEDEGDDFAGVVGVVEHEDSRAGEVDGWGAVGGGGTAGL